MASFKFILPPFPTQSLFVIFRPKSVVFTAKSGKHRGPFWRARKNFRPFYKYLTISFSIIFPLLSSFPSKRSWRIPRPKPLSLRATHNLRRLPSQARGFPKPGVQHARPRLFFFAPAPNSIDASVIWRAPARGRPAQRPCRWSTQKDLFPFFSLLAFESLFSLTSGEHLNCL